MTRYRSRESLVFGVATVVILVHALDDAFVHRQPGVGVGQHALAAAIAICVGLASAAGFPSLRPGLRATVAFGFGVLALVNGMLHVAHIEKHGPAASDLSGGLAAAAGAVLVGLAVAIPWRHRGEGAARSWRRWTYRVLAVPAGLIAAFFTVLPVGMAIVDAHKFREPVGAPPSAAYEEVNFRASDGLDIAGWYLIAAPLISADRHEERDFNVIYEHAARGPVEHWNLPDARHTAAIREHPKEYERRVAAFFDEALL